METLYDRLTLKIPEISPHLKFIYKLIDNFDEATLFSIWTEQTYILCKVTEKNVITDELLISANNYFNSRFDKEKKRFKIEFSETNITISLY